MKRIKNLFIGIILTVFCVSLISCGDIKEDTTQKNYDGRVFYEIFVRSFNDSDGDGIGDLQGVIDKLDYLKDLGVNGIWLMPILESSSYHGYDVDDYYSIDEEYGTMKDFEKLLKEAHKRDIKVIMDMVINHTSVNNEWFKSACEGEDSEYRDYYIWTDDMSKAGEMSPMNTKAWSKNGDKEELYYSIFWSGMPDLNYDNQKVMEEVKKICKFYLDKDIDGFRFDAAKWIYNNTDKNVKMWSELSEYLKSINKDCIEVAEVWDSPYNTAPYTKALDSFFEFSTGEYIANRVRKQSISGFVNDYIQVRDIYKEENKNFIMAPFLTNHDQNRIADTLTDTYQLKIAAAMYLTLPGTPFIYYGEEIGMKGSGIDENKRQPFVWSNNDKKLNTSWEKVTFDTSKIALNVEEKDKDSLYNFYKDILNVRNKYKSLRYGEIDSLDTEDTNVMGMIRTYNDETSYVLINGNMDEMEIELPKGKYYVAYSNGDREEELKSDGKIKLSGEEITILIKK